MVRELQTSSPTGTVRSETTKDKAGALPPAVYAFQPSGNESDERLRFPEEIDIIRSNSVTQPVVSIQFVNDGDVFEMFEDHREVQIKLMNMRQILMTKKPKMKNI